MTNQKIEISGCLTRHKSRTRFIGTVLTLTALVPLVAMTGCANHSKRHFTVGSVQDSYKTRHPVVVDEREQTLDVPIVANTRSLPVAQSGAVQGFASRFKKAGSGTMTILLPQGSSNEKAARHISRSIVDSVTTQGVPHNRIQLVNYDASQHGPTAPIRLSYLAVTANVGECGKWDDDLAGANLKNKNYHNFGCANQKNFAAMISNPSDLISPRGMSEIDASRRENVIQDYRDGKAALGDDLRTVFN